MTGVRYRAADGAEASAAAYLTVVCDGMYSGLRTKLSVPDLTSPSYFVGLLLTVRAPGGLRGVGSGRWREQPTHPLCSPSPSLPATPPIPSVG